MINYTATTFSFEKYQNWHVLAPENYLKIRLCYIVKDRDRLSAKRQVHTGSNERSFAHCCHSLCQSSTVLQEKKIPISLSWNLSEFHGFASFPILVNSSKSPKRAGEGVRLYDRLLPTNGLFSLAHCKNFETPRLTMPWQCFLLTLWIRFRI